MKHLQQAKSMVVAAITMTVWLLTMAGCSKDEPNPDAWRDNLKSVMELVPGGTITGMEGYRGLDFLISIVTSDNDDLLDYVFGSDDIKNSDWYFEKDGKQYHLGDVMEIEGNTSPIYVGQPMYLPKSVIYPTKIEWDILKEKGSIHYSFTFVWPSKNIRKKMDFYAEYNESYEAEKEALQKTLGETEIGSVEKYKAGCWIDDKPLNTIMSQLQVWTITLD